MWFSSVQFSSVQLLSCVPLFVTPWIAARQASLSMEFSRQEYWCGLLLQGIFPTQGLQADSLPSEASLSREALCKKLPVLNYTTVFAQDIWHHYWIDISNYFKWIKTCFLIFPHRLYPWKFSLRIMGKWSLVTWHWIATE